MMFLYYFIPGAFIPILSLYFKNYLNFSGYQTGLILSMSAGAAFISPFLGAFVADRIISSERLLALIMFSGGSLLLILSFQTSFPVVFCIYSLYSLIFGPSPALTNAICFHHLSDSSRDFGAIRKWGTIGWISAGWLFSLLWLRESGDSIHTERVVDALRLGGFSAFVLGIFCFFLPRLAKKEIPPETGQSFLSKLFPLDSFKVFLNPRLILLCFCALGIAIVDRYYYYGISIFLKQSGLSPDKIMPVMSIGQVPEIFGMIFLGFFIHRFGVKAAFLVGIITEGLRFFLLAVGSPFGVIIAGVTCHGFAYAFFFTTLYIFIDTCSSKKARTGVHQLFAIITSGLGAFLGNQISGGTADLLTNTITGEINFRTFWIVPAIISVLILAVVFFFFSDKKPNRQEPGSF